MLVHLAPFEHEIRAMGPSCDIIDEAALLWRLTTYMRLKLRSLHPNWLFYGYEDLARAPTEFFGDMLHRLGLEFTHKIRDHVVRATNPNVSGWKGDLSPKEVGAYRARVDELSTRSLNADAEW
jgi:hypothetical protein